MENKFLPKKSDYSGLRIGFKSDLIAGITVGIVALPLAIAFGITTGTGAASGLITAIIAGFIAAIFGGSNYQVSGPTGAMTVVLVPIVSKFGISTLVPLGIFAGLIVCSFGLLKLGSLISKVPWPVMEGFTFGIALVIALQQIPSALAVQSAKGNGTLGNAYNTIRFAFNHGLNWKSIFVVLLTLLIKFSYAPISKKFSFKFYLPASFVTIILVTILVYFLNIKVPLVGELPRNIFRISTLKYPSSITSLIVPAIEISLLAAIESLLSARLADGMARKHLDFQSYDPNRELFGQGLATGISSIFGGMPGTGAIARSGVNVRAGAKTRAAAAIHSIFLLCAILFFNPLIAHIPTPALAGVLIGTSYRIARPSVIMEALTTNWISGVTLVITAIIVLVVDLIWGIVIGCVIYFVLNKINSKKIQSGR